ncbi:hypothetical protein ABFS82_13G060000 [Erythranthe guttata]|uniref:Bystin n=1 Tax=Erythranthe guttata TaxID=4155 RepID=A0A022RCY0_ERYGU|nr:PREDICTED: bystin-like [Erythranthe guttata]XP_012836476.1 PREDICTED: bystin-like [Erythranthe guttata]EYU38207.1 hypothetical protein MIMGU_mgv1a006128mg [Erythranthe guttata]|eukprot:XP_012836475.1 PREDICTED: bystin-like [Erythranthe guttata]
MSKKRGRITNPEPFLPLGSDAFFSSNKRSKQQKNHQLHQKLLPSAASSKILKEALLQQKEIQHEEDNEINFSDQNPNNNFALPQLHGLKDNRGEDDVGDFEGFPETQTQFGQHGFEDEIDEEDEKLLEAFLSKDGRLQALADTVVDRIKEKDAQLSTETKTTPKSDEYIELYKGVGKMLSKYTSGKIPKLLRHIASMECWEEVLNLTEPENWSPHAMHQATRIFASTMDVKKVERFYKLVLLPFVRRDIRNNKKLRVHHPLHPALHLALKKALYKPAAFNKGFLFPLCESRTCSKEEARIIGDILKKMSIPVLHSSVALLKLAGMEYFSKTSLFITILIEKKYALPYRVLDALVAHFMKYYDESDVMPVVWHQSLLAFAQSYKNELTKEDKTNLKTLVGRQRHNSITSDILMELNNSRNRGEKDDDLMSISRPHSLVTKTIQEDRFDIPDVPMEED